MDHKFIRVYLKSILYITVLNHEIMSIKSKNKQSKTKAINVEAIALQRLFRDKNPRLIVYNLMLY